MPARYVAEVAESLGTSAGPLVRTGDHRSVRDGWMAESRIALGVAHTLMNDLRALGQHEAARQLEADPSQPP